MPALLNQYLLYKAVLEVPYEHSAFINVSLKDKTVYGNFYGLIMNLEKVFIQNRNCCG